MKRIVILGIIALSACTLSPAGHTTQRLSACGHLFPYFTDFVEDKGAKIFTDKEEPFIPSDFPARPSASPEIPIKPSRSISCESTNTPAGIMRISSASPQKNVDLTDERLRYGDIFTAQNMNVTLYYETHGFFKKTSRTAASCAHFSELKVTRFNSLEDFTERLLALILEKSKIRGDLDYRSLHLEIEGYREASEESWQHVLSCDNSVKSISLIVVKP